ncbi:hypothetical protein Aperf_G00000128284 [Anoplocephala perfoliata]
MDENVGDTDQVDEVLTKLKAYCMAAIGEMFLLNDIIMELLFGDSDKATYNQILVDTDEREIGSSERGDQSRLSPNVVEIDIANASLRGLVVSILRSVESVDFAAIKKDAERWWMVEHPPSAMEASSSQYLVYKIGLLQSTVVDLFNTYDTTETGLSFHTHHSPCMDYLCIILCVIRFVQADSSSFFPSTEPGGVLSLSFAFKTFDGLLASGDECDVFDACDLFFKICVKSENNRDCDVFNVKTSPLQNVASVSYEGSSAFLFSFRPPTNRIQVVIEAWDYDIVSGDDYIGRYYGTVLIGNISREETPLKLQRAKTFFTNHFTFEASMQKKCNPGFFGHICQYRIGDSSSSHCSEVVNGTAQQIVMVHLPQTTAFLTPVVVMTPLVIFILLCVYLRKNFSFKVTRKLERPTDVIYESVENDFRPRKAKHLKDFGGFSQEGSY